MSANQSDPSSSGFDQSRRHQNEAPALTVTTPEGKTERAEPALTVDTEILPSFQTFLFAVRTNQAVSDAASRTKPSGIVKPALLFSPIFDPQNPPGPSPAYAPPTIDKSHRGPIEPPFEPPSGSDNPGPWPGGLETGHSLDGQPNHEQAAVRSQHTLIEEDGVMQTFPREMESTQGVSRRGIASRPWTKNLRNVTDGEFGEMTESGEYRTVDRERATDESPDGVDKM